MPLAVSALTVAVKVTVSLAPVARPPRFQLMVLPVSVPPFCATTLVRLGSIASVTVTLVALASPALGTLMV